MSPLLNSNDYKSICAPYVIGIKRQKLITCKCYHRHLCCPRSINLFSVACDLRVKQGFKNDRIVPSSIISIFLSPLLIDPVPTTLLSCLLYYRLCHRIARLLTVCFWVLLVDKCSLEMYCNQRSVAYKQKYIYRLWTLWEKKYRIYYYVHRVFQ